MVKNKIKEVKIKIWVKNNQGVFIKCWIKNKRSGENKMEKNEKKIN